jgi:hypothetical protein
MQKACPIAYMVFPATEMKWSPRCGSLTQEGYGQPLYSGLGSARFCGTHFYEAANDDVR